MKWMFCALLLCLMAGSAGRSSANETLDPTLVQAQTMYVEIHAQHTNKCLDVAGIRSDNGAPVIQWDCWGGSNQQWRLEPVGNGYYQIRARHTNKCLDVAGIRSDNGAPVIQWDCWGSSNQQWRLEPVSTLPTEPPTIDRFTIAPRQITSGQSITITWRVIPSPYCTPNVRLTQKNFYTGAVLAERNGLDISGTLTDRPQIDSDYFLDAWCDDGPAAQQRRISVGVSNPNPIPPSSYCFKVVYQVPDICSAFAYAAASLSDAEQCVCSQNPEGIVALIDCSQMTTACSQNLTGMVINCSQMPPAPLLNETAGGRRTGVLGVHTRSACE